MDVTHVKPRFEDREAHDACVTEDGRCTNLSLYSVTRQFSLDEETDLEVV
jgi:hypothetical protein